MSDVQNDKFAESLSFVDVLIDIPDNTHSLKVIATVLDEDTGENVDVVSEYDNEEVQRLILNHIRQDWLFKLP